MNNIAALALEEAIRFSLNEFIKWQQNQARDPNWKPSVEDVSKFLGDIRSDTVEKIEAEARQELGMPPKESST